MAGSGRIEGIKGLRHEKLGLSVRLMGAQVSYDLLMGGAFTQDTLDDFPIESWEGWSRDFLDRRTTLSREDGAVLASFGLDLGDGILADSGVGVPGIPGSPRFEEEFANLLVRLICEYD